MSVKNYMSKVSRENLFITGHVMRLIQKGYEDGMKDSGVHILNNRIERAINWCKKRAKNNRHGQTTYTYLLVSVVKILEGGKSELEP